MNNINPFQIDNAKRILAYPDTPAAYVDWKEIFPLFLSEYKTYFGNLFNWYFPNVQKSIGSSRKYFENIFIDANEDLLDDFMLSLAKVPIEDFFDFYIPFIKNFKDLRQNNHTDYLVSKFLELYKTKNDNQVIKQISQKLKKNYPENLIIEITQSCNYACLMCSSRTNGFLPAKTMKLEEFGELIHFFSDKVKSIRINGYGETSIVPNLKNYVDCFEEFAFKGLKEIITNLSAPTQIYEYLIDKDFVLMVSWDATEKALFEHIRVNSDYNTLFERLKILGNKVKNTPEQICLLCTIQEINLHEISNIVKLAGNVGVGLVIFNMIKEKDCSPWMDRRFEEIKCLFSQATDLAQELGIKIRVPDHIGNNRLKLATTSRTSATFCNRPWNELLIRYDQELNVCNMFNPYSYGSLRIPTQEIKTQARFEKLWNGSVAWLFREIINSQNPHYYCHKCYFLYD